VGRSHDVLRTASGTEVTPAEAVAAVLPGAGTLVDFQVTQRADRRLAVLVVQREGPETAADRERVARVLDRLVRPPEPPAVERVASIPLTPGGKLRTLVSAS